LISRPSCQFPAARLLPDSTYTGSLPVGKERHFYIDVTAADLAKGNLVIEATRPEEVLRVFIQPICFCDN
jgi:hypothetical protein